MAAWAPFGLIRVCVPKCSLKCLSFAPFDLGRGRTAGRRKGIDEWDSSRGEEIGTGRLLR